MTEETEKDFPDDADGDALRHIAAHSDISLPMDVYFMVAVPNQAAAEEVASLALQRGYRCSVEFDDQSRQWTCYCRKRMLVSHAGVLAAQQELDELSAPVGGYSDGGERSEWENGRNGVSGSHHEHIQGFVSAFVPKRRRPGWLAFFPGAPSKWPTGARRSGTWFARSL